MWLQYGDNDSPCAQVARIKGLAQGVRGGRERRLRDSCSAQKHKKKRLAWWSSASPPPPTATPAAAARTPVHRAAAETSRAPAADTRQLRCLCLLITVISLSVPRHSYAKDDKLIWHLMPEVKSSDYIQPNHYNNIVQSSKSIKKSRKIIMSLI